MTGHFTLIGTPEELTFKNFGENGEKEVAEWKIGYARFKSFSTTVLAMLRENKGDVMISGEVREKAGTGNHVGKVFDEWIVFAVQPMKKGGGAKQEQPKQQAPPDDSGLPF